MSQPLAQQNLNQQNLKETPQFEMRKRTETKEDGRILIYYTFSAMSEKQKVAEVKTQKER